MEVLLHQFQIASVDRIKWSVSHNFTYEKETLAYFVWKDVFKDDEQNTRVPTKQ